MKRLLATLAVILANPVDAQVYKCESGGRIVYQAQACADPEQARTLQDRMTVVDPHPPVVVQRKARTGSAQPTSTAIIGTHDEHRSCVTLRNRIRKIDATARQRSTQQLSDRRRAAVQEMAALGCSRIGLR